MGQRGRRERGRLYFLRGRSCGDPNMRKERLEAADGRRPP